MRLPRSSGILLHPTSLPGPHGSGDLGVEAHHFVDWLAAAGQRLWQILPLGGIGAGNSPYMSNSAFAGNALLVDLHELARRGWLDADDLRPDADFDAARVDYTAVVPWRLLRLERAARRFAAQATIVERQEFAEFCSRHARWLDDYALFMAIGDAFPGQTWCDWPAPLALRDPAALVAARQQHAGRIGFWKFVQWCFLRQWHALRAHAWSKGVRIVGDVPIFVSYHSADVWAHQSLFHLDENGRPSLVAGVPPDFFSPTGQRWGNPLYDWPTHADQGYAWWIERIRHLFELVDIVRIDHFRGFAAYWEIPADEPTAVHGRWVPGPGEGLFNALAGALGEMPIIAEDLGVITPEVHALRRKFALPGMRILQFAFGDDCANPFLPHNHEADTVVYSGTHDNDTTVGWWASASEKERDHVRRYFGTHGDDIAWTFIRAALASVADTAIVPMQDVLELGSAARMNQPAVADGWWEWRMRWEQVQPWHAERLAELTRLYRRDGTPLKA